MHGAFKGDLAAAERLFEAREENMIAILAMIRNIFGSWSSRSSSGAVLVLRRVEQVRRNLVVESKTWPRHEQSLDQLQTPKN